MSGNTGHLRSPKAKYPRVVGRDRLPIVPICCIVGCKSNATWLREVQVSYMRGDDIRVPVCDEHVRDDEAILRSQGVL